MENVLHQVFAFAYISAQLYLINLAALLKSDEEIFGALRKCGSRLHRARLNLVACIAFPVNRTLDFTFKVGWEA